MTRSETVVQDFLDEANCAQAVFGAYAEGHGLDSETARSLACGFGGGMGRTGSVCGAVAGAVMVIGLIGAKRAPEASSAKTYVYSLVSDFLERFTKNHQTTMCSELLGCDISTPEGYEKAAKLRLFTTKCPEYVRDAVSILDEIL